MSRGRRVAPAKLRGAVFGALVVLGLAAAGCSSSANSATSTYVAAGQIPQADRPAGGAHGAHVNADAVTIPLAKQNPTTALFSAVATFQSCLTGRGVTFQGAPDPKNPSSPANDPNYVKSLVDVRGAEQDPPGPQDGAERAGQPDSGSGEEGEQGVPAVAQVHAGRGWGIPQPTPNAKGLLFSFGGSGGQEPQFTPPPGQNLISSPDLEACAAKAQGESS